MKILAVCQAYPSEQKPGAMAFVHSRNLLYAAAGHSIDVLSFSTNQNDNWAGVQVFKESDLSTKEFQAYDAIVFHAPNLRNHLRLLKSHAENFKKLVFVIHMTEWIRHRGYHPTPYAHVGFKKRYLDRLAFGVYDEIKLRTWRQFLKANRFNPEIIFVSQWIKDQASRCIGFDFEKSPYKTHVIHNPIHPAFADAAFDPAAPKDADFVTLRPFDDAKYGVDILCEIAKRYPDKTFHLFGRGEYFNHQSAPKNLSVFQKIFPQSEMPALMSRYRAAILPTRLDSQGVMMCEIAAMGMPLYVSDLPICREMVGEFKNVGYFDNSAPNFRYEVQADSVGAKVHANKFLNRQTTAKELEVFKKQ